MVAQEPHPHGVAGGPPRGEDLGGVVAEDYGAYACAGEGLWGLEGGWLVRIEVMQG